MTTESEMVFVYIIQSEIDNGYYIGICKDILIRINKHNIGGVVSTRHRKPFKLVYSEEYNNYGDARNREKQIKSYKGGNAFKRLITK